MYAATAAKRVFLLGKCTFHMALACGRCATECFHIRERQNLWRLDYINEIKYHCSVTMKTSWGLPVNRNS